MLGFRIQLELEYKSVGASVILCLADYSILYNMTFTTTGTTTIPMVTTTHFTKYFGINIYDSLFLEHPGKFHKGLKNGNCKIEYHSIFGLHN